MLGYTVDGKRFATFRGLVKYLLSKHDATEVGAITRDRKLFVRGRSSTSSRSVIACYAVATPEVGKLTALTAEVI